MPAAEVDLDAVVDRLLDLEREVEGLRTVLRCGAAGTLGGLERGPGERPARPPLYRLDDGARVALVAGAAEREARVRELRAELEQLTAEQAAAEQVAEEAFPNTLAGDAALEAADLGPLRDAHRALSDVGEVDE